MPDFVSLSRKKKLETLADWGRQAPSAHNSQPWLFQINETDNSITVKPNHKRLLGYSDPDKRQFYLSLGAATANLVLAADGYGLSSAITTRATEDGHVETRVTFSATPDKLPQTENFLHLSNRHNNRNAFFDQPIPREFIELAESLAAGQASLDIISDQATKQQIQDIVGQATHQAFTDKNFTRELADWMHPSLKKYRDGFVGYNLGMPWLLSFAFPHMLRHLPLAKPQTKMQLDMLKHAPSYAVLSAAEDNPEQWLKTGRVFEHIAVAAHKHGLKVGVFGAPIETGEHYKKLQGLLKRGERPQIFFRIGFTNNVPKKSPRLNLEEVLI